jgi:hypothetical protein
VASTDGFKGARAVGLVMGHGVDVLLGQLDRRCVGKKRAYYQQNVSGRGTPSFVLGQGCAEMGGTAWSTIAVRVVRSIPMEITKAMKLLGD